MSKKIDNDAHDLCRGNKEVLYSCIKGYSQLAVVFKGIKTFEENML